MSSKYILNTLMVLLVLVAPSFCIELLDTFYFERSFALSFDRQLISEGQWWRMLAGHLDHFGWSHFLLNVVFLGLLLFMFPVFRSLQFLIILLCSYFIGISILIWFFSEGLDVYVGLSGSLYGLLSFALLRDKSYPLMLRGLVFIVLLSKVIYEYINGASAEISGLIGGAVAIDVHLYGVLVGAISVLILRFARF